MKKLIFLLLIPVMASGQIPNRSRMLVRDTIYRDSTTVYHLQSYSDDTLIGGGGGKVYPADLFITGTTAHFVIDTVVRYDTARVIMFYSDTTNWCKETDCRIYNYGMFWQFGYRVLKMQGNWPIDYPDTYLDENKKRLPKNIIVWQTQ